MLCRVASNANCMASLYSTKGKTTGVHVFNWGAAPAERYKWLWVWKPRTTAKEEQHKLTVGYKIQVHIFGFWWRLWTEENETPLGVDCIWRAAFAESPDTEVHASGAGAAPYEVIKEIKNISEIRSNKQFQKLIALADKLGFKNEFICSKLEQIHAGLYVCICRLGNYIIESIYVGSDKPNDQPGQSVVNQQSAPANRGKCRSAYAMLYAGARLPWGCG